MRSWLTDDLLVDPAHYLTYRRTSAPKFMFSSTIPIGWSRHFSEWDDGADELQSKVDALKRGDLCFFSGRVVHVGMPPDWHKNPFSGHASPANQHWTDIDEFSSGDIKFLWEPGRFSFVYDLVRAYYRTGDENLVEQFWIILEDWRERNPPEQGVAWKDGQEVSFRVMAWCFALYAFLQSSATTPERVTKLAQMIAWSGERIEGNIRYALSQRNNHGMSEAMGLFTIGILFPEFKPSTQWEKRGRRLLEMLAKNLIYDDGSFSQHSVNYHRLLLHDYLWCLRLADLNGKPFSANMESRLAQALEWLFQLRDQQSGQAPNYGHNDGSLILPLNSCTYRDLRPVLQSMHYQIHRSRCFPPGPWDEDLLWLFGPDALSSPRRDKALVDFSAEDGGCYTLRSHDGFAFVRCSRRFRHRPAHADLLHVDVWWKGVNVLCDAGTYSYNSDPPWNNALAATVFHNTVTVDGKSQMDSVSRFLWLPWPKGSTRRNRSPRDICGQWEGAHDGYTRLDDPVVHRREVVPLGDDHWLVVDSLSGCAPHLYRLQWLMPDVPYEWDEESRRIVLKINEEEYVVQAGLAVGVNTSSDASLVRGDSTSPRGWISPTYGVRVPGLSLAVTTFSPGMRFWTIAGPIDVGDSFRKGDRRVSGRDWTVKIVLDGEGPRRRIASVDMMSRPSGQGSAAA